jgi:hypothetical protein
VSPDEVSLCESSRCEPVATAGKEHFSLWLKEPGVPAPRFITAWIDEPWPEFIPGYHYDVNQPSVLQPLCSPPGVPSEVDTSPVFPPAFSEQGGRKDPTE